MSKIHLKPFWIKNKFFLGKIFVEIFFSKLNFLCIGFFWYCHGYYTKVICMSALKLFSRENKSIKINPTDFSTRSKFQDEHQGAFFFKIHFRPFWILKKSFIKKTKFCIKNPTIPRNFWHNRKFKICIVFMTEQIKIKSIFTEIT